MQLTNSPVDNFILQDRQILVKRDELLDQRFNGNKARKLAYYITNSFPTIDTLISYGGTQSNMLSALSELAKIKSWSFIYYCYKPSQMALNNSHGNLATALHNGTQFNYVDKDLDSFMAKSTIQQNQLLIHQGARQAESQFGIQQLANEINQYCLTNLIDKLALFIPSGTGASAYYLQKLLPQHIVYTTNCVGTAEYLLKQWRSLDSNATILPIILPNESFRFATPDKLLWKTIDHITQISQIEFDLVYDPVGWHILINNMHAIELPIMYIHCGGLIGNHSMQKRYDYLFTNKS